jgi:hypothetical protein
MWYPAVKVWLMQNKNLPAYVPLAQLRRAEILKTIFFVHTHTLPPLL